mmetsp:Transcript_42600/g.132903  ORF Transcript_42600/g.132903 Transcript_42600/m.132903 type:complete len:240 (-) Transcript_42600:61-780(-)
MPVTCSIPHLVMSRPSTCFSFCTRAAGAIFSSWLRSFISNSAAFCSVACQGDCFGAAGLTCAFASVFFSSSLSEAPLSEEEDSLLLLSDCELSPASLASSSSSSSLSLSSGPRASEEGAVPLAAARASCDADCSPPAAAASPLALPAPGESGATARRLARLCAWPWSSSGTMNSGTSLSIDRANTSPSITRMVMFLTYVLASLSLPLSFFSFLSFLSMTFQTLGYGSQGVGVPASLAMA